MTRGICSHCMKETDKSELKRCSGCQYLLYCSKECQTLSWKAAHKYNCRKGDVVYDGNTRSAKEERGFTSWLYAWRTSLSITATAALDLANHESDYLLNHCLHIQLKRTGHKTDAKRFTIDEIGVSHVDLLRREYPDPEVASILVDPPELVGKRVRYIAVVRVGEVVRVRGCAWVERNIEMCRNLSREESRMAATGFMTKLVSVVGAGDIGAIPGMMKAKEC